MLTLASDARVLARFGHALSDPTRCRLLLALRDAPAYPADLADGLGVSRTNLPNHLACVRGGLVVAVPEGRYELADRRLAQALADLIELAVAVDPDAACPADATAAAHDHPAAPAGHRGSHAMVFGLHRFLDGAAPQTREQGFGAT